MWLVTAVSSVHIKFTCVLMLVHIVIYIIYVQCSETCQLDLYTHVQSRVYVPAGRSSMKQFMPMKPVKRGFKVWVRADSVTGYFCDLDIYIGKPSDGTTTEVGLGERVVLQLSERLRGGHYQLFCDNYFITSTLLDTLLKLGLYACGTTRTVRKGFPETLKQVTLKRGEHIFCQRGNLVASVWMDKMPVKHVIHPFPG